VDSLATKENEVPILTIGHGPNKTKVIVSLCDYSGNWPRPYADAGYTVIQFDLKHGDDCLQVQDVLDDVRDCIINASDLAPMRGCGTHWREFKVVGVMAAPLCTTFANSGARWWPRHEEDGTRDMGVRLANACMDIIEALQPRWWALENPAGRLGRLVPRVGSAWFFHPWQYAKAGTDPEENRYTKLTGIWGTATKPASDGLEMEPVMYEKTRKDGRTVRGSWMWAKLGGKSERTKALRSNTPDGFARAFMVANP
jgi:hypothetical protein